ncbi:hypothetical protein KUL152_16230 [Tenacibaculum sp. KUL152]|nr:hypothetical protein KUL152_16230 [Tenacibaculum sp. KUL152]
MKIVIWLAVVCIANWLLKRAMGVSFFSAFSDSTKISKACAFLLNALFVTGSFLSLFVVVY